MKIVVAVSALALAIGMAGCSGESEPSETVTVSSSESPSSTPTPDEDMYVDVLRDEIPGLSDNDQDLINLGETVCVSFDEGLSLYSIADSLVEGGFSEYDAGFVIGASVPAFCPEHMDKIDTEEDITNG